MIKEYLEQMVGFRQLNGAPNTRYRCPEQLVLELGRTPKQKVKAPWTGAPKNCYVNAAMAAISGEGFYTEGYYESVIPIMHA